MVGIDTSIATRQVAFDYDRTVVAFHGTRRRVADQLVAGEAFGQSENDDDWLGSGIYFWEYAPQQAWWWAERRYGVEEAAVVGSLMRLGRCVDLLDPSNALLLEEAHRDLERVLASTGAAAVSQQAPSEVWSPARLLAALKQGTDQDRLAAMRDAGIIDERGNVTGTYKSWGTKVTRTPYANDLD